jgi:hypothetical protein
MNGGVAKLADWTKCRYQANWAASDLIWLVSISFAASTLSRVASLKLEQTISALLASRSASKPSSSVSDQQPTMIVARGSFRLTRRTE